MMDFELEKRGDVLVLTRRTKEGAPVEYFHDTTTRAAGDGTGYRLTDRERLDELLFVLHTTGQVTDDERGELHKVFKDYLSKSEVL